MDKKVTAILINGKAEYSCNGKTALSISLSEGGCTAHVYYTFREEPLVLSAPAKANDQAALILRPHRLELYINGSLADEEWPCGSALLSGSCLPSGDFSLTLSETDSEESGKPLAEKKEAITLEAIYQSGINLGDCMPFSEGDGTTGYGDGQYHLFYLYDRHHHRSKWGLGAHQWAHISTQDFKTWYAFPMAIPITESWEGSICTGSVIQCGTSYYAWYAVRMCDGSPAKITAAVSNDLCHFTKSEACFTLPSNYDTPSARDPKVIDMNGTYHMFVTTSLSENGLGCLAHLVSEKMAVDSNSWKDAGPIVICCDKTQPECPDYFCIGNYYYLVYSLDGKARYIYSETPFGESGWIEPENNIIPCGTVPKSAAINGQRIFSGFVPKSKDAGYAGYALFVKAEQNPDGSLSFQPL